MSISKHLFNTSSDRMLENGLENRGYFLSLLHTASFKSFIFCFLIFFSAIGADAQTQTEFRKILHDRSAKIVNTLEIAHSGKYNKIVEILTDQYFNLNKIHDKSKERIAAIKSLRLSEEEKKTRIKKEGDEKIARLSKLHKGFIAKLQKRLTEDQIEKIKDGMTYRVMPLTYGAYQEIILTLTTEQKEKIYKWLKEARELAMDEGSSEDKHKVFGKFKGKINNYLSAEGYDMKKEEKAWQQRIKEKEAAKKIDVAI